MAQLIQAVQAVMADNEWPYQEFDSSTLRMDVTGSHGNWVTFIKCLEEIDQILIYGFCTHKTPADRQQAMAEFIARANYGLRIGNFEMDFEDGEVRFKTSLHLRPDCTPNGMIEQAIYDNGLTMDHYLPGIMRVMFSDTPPQQIIQEIEGG